MSFIRTVLGDIPPDLLGTCYSHEHIIIDSSFTTHLHPDFLLDSVELACDELTRFHEAGGRAMVDSMPCGGGRNVVKLAAISHRTGVHILCPTGLHLAKYYPPGHWGNRFSAAALAELFIAEIEIGIDANDYAGPRVERTSSRAGLIKVAGGLNGLDDRQRKVFEAAAIAHRRTGAPILTHTEQGTGAIEQVEQLRAGGVDPRRVVLSHTDRKPDVGYHKEVLSTGVYVEFDSGFRWPTDESNKTVNLVTELFSLGFGRQIMLGMDAARRSYWRAYGGSPGLTYLLKTFVPKLRADGLSMADVDQMFLLNPREAYAFTGTG
jgi:phosphotriesterase-related protein